MYPTEVEITPGRFQNLRSAPQKQPVAKNAFSITAESWHDFSLIVF
jgi:hypothetical protein